MSTIERMSEYFKIVDGFAPSMDCTSTNKVAYMYDDLQASMQALEVAREALYNMRIDTYYDRASMPSQQKCVAALKTIDSILGEKK